MTIQKEVVLWENGDTRLCMFPIPPTSQYIYPVTGAPCITFGISFENRQFKGADHFTLFDGEYDRFLQNIQDAICIWDGTFRLQDAGCDTDGYVEFTVGGHGNLKITGQLGSTWSEFHMCFGMNGDQTILTLLENSLAVCRRA